MCLYEYTTIGTVCQERIRVRRPPHSPAALRDRRLQTRCQANRIRGVPRGRVCNGAQERPRLGAVALQCAAARSLAQMSRDSKVKMRALRGERLEKRKIKSRARRPPPVNARRRSAAVGFWTRRCGGTEGRARQRRCRLCCVRDILYGIWQTACELALFCRQNST